MDIYLSIVLAVYNTEKLIGRMLDSILQQSYKEFELIIVDDGSIDMTANICDMYAIKDSRIRVIHQKNQGSVIARKNGLKVSKGVYVSFIDGDDWIDNDFYEKMLYNCNNSDVIVSGCIMENDGISNFWEHSAKNGYYDGDLLDGLFENLLCNGSFNKQSIAPALWNKLFKRELLMKLNLNIPASVRMGEDACVSYPAMFNAKSIYVRNEIKSYHYCVSNSSMSKAYDKEFFSRIEQVYLWFCYCIQMISVNNIREQVSEYMFMLIRMGIYQELYRGNILYVADNLRLLSKHIKLSWMSEAVSLVNKDKLVGADLLLYRAIKKQSIIRWGLRQYITKIFSK